MEPVHFQHRQQKPGQTTCLCQTPLAERAGQERPTKVTICLSLFYSAQLSSLLTCNRRLSVLGEAGLLPPLEVASKAAEALSPFISQPPLLQQVVAAATTPSPAALLCSHPVSPVTPSTPTTTDGTLPSLSTAADAGAATVFGCPAGPAAATNLAAAFLSLSAWMGRSAAAAAAVASAGGPAAQRVQGEGSSCLQLPVGVEVRLHSVSKVRIYLVLSDLSLLQYGLEECLVENR